MAAGPKAVALPNRGVVRIAGEEALNQADRIHPNTRGALLLAERMLPAVERLIAQIPA